MDLRATSKQKEINAIACETTQSKGEVLGQMDAKENKIIAVASMIAKEARHAVKTETGFRCSAGIASNKLLAKLCSGLHKPDDQTILLPSEAQVYFSWQICVASVNKYK